MVTKQIRPEARAKAAQIEKEIGLKLRLLIDGVRIDDNALEGMGTIYKEKYAYMFDAVHKRTGKGRMIPSEVELPAGTLVGIREDTESPHVLRQEDGHLVIKSGRRLLTEVSYLPRPAYYTKKTSDGVEMRRVLPSIGKDCLVYVLSTFCHYDRFGGTCHFCNINWAQSEHHDERVQMGKKLGQLKEVATEVVRDGRFAHFILTGGTMPEERERAGMLAVLQTYKEVLGVDKLPITVTRSAPSSPEVLEELHDHGCASVGLDIEVWNPDYFRAICPGKNNLPGRDNWIQALKWGVEIFGKGKVRSAFVAGIEPMEYTLEGIEYLCSIGVQPTPYLWCPEPGSKFWRHRTPTMDWYLELFQKTADFWFKYGFVQPGLLDPTNPSACLRCPPAQVFAAEINRRMILEDPDWVWPTAPSLKSLMKKGANLEN